MAAYADMITQLEELKSRVDLDSLLLMLEIMHTRLHHPRGCVYFAEILRLYSKPVESAESSVSALMDVFVRFKSAWVDAGLVDKSSLITLFCVLRYNAQKLVYPGMHQHLNACDNATHSCSLRTSWHSYDVSSAESRTTEPQLRAQLLARLDCGRRAQSSVQTGRCPRHRQGRGAHYIVSRRLVPVSRHQTRFPGICLRVPLRLLAVHFRGSSGV